MIYDAALEANRRVAWARYYQTRDDLRQVTMWAAELAEWVEVLAPTAPPEVRELAALVRAPLDRLDHLCIRRAVRARRGVAA